MAFARDSYTASASQTDFTITFPYLSEDDINVTVDGVVLDNDADADTGSFQIVSTTTVRIGAGLAGSETVVIYRTTSQSTRLVDYASASTLTEEDLDNDSLQAFYMCQEAIDTAGTALGLGSTDLWDANNTIIDNVATPTADDHAATKGYVDDSISTAALGSLTTPISIANGGTAAATAAAARTNLGLVIGTDVQAEVITTRGDLVYGNATPAAARLAIGAANRVLRSDGTDVAWGQVATDDITDDAVTLAKLAAGTDGELITWDASGDPATVAVGTSGQVLTSNGAGAAPTFQDASAGGGYTLLEDSGTLSSVATYSFDSDVVNTSTYKRFRLVFSAISATTASQNLIVLVQDGGVNETTNYGGGAQDSAGDNTNSAHIRCSAQNGAAAHVSGYVDLFYETTLDYVFFGGFSVKTDTGTLPTVISGVYTGGFGTAFDGITASLTGGNYDGSSRLLLYGAP